MTARTVYCRDKSPLILSQSKFSFIFVFEHAATPSAPCHTDDGQQGMLGAALQVLRNHPEDDCDGQQVATHSSNPRTYISVQYPPRW